MKPAYPFILFFLVACSPNQEVADAPIPAAPDPVPTATAANPFEHFDISTSVRSLMNDLIQPNVLTVWQAVRYVVNEEGVQEDVVPQTDEDWDRLRTSALVLVEAGNVLLLPGRVMDEEAPGPDYPAYQYTPVEMEALMETQAEAWRAYLQEMQFSTKATLETIENRDILGLMETGARINNACQGCHAQFWYRPNN